MSQTSLCQENLDVTCRPTGVDRLPVGADAGVAETAGMGVVSGHILLNVEPIEIMGSTKSLRKSCPIPEYRR
jgi:hypothetical protein